MVLLLVLLQFDVKACVMCIHEELFLEMTRREKTVIIDQTVGSEKSHKSRLYLSACLSKRTTTYKMKILPKLFKDCKRIMFMLFVHHSACIEFVLTIHFLTRYLIVLSSI
jgi:hypothetical protein